MAGSQPVPSRLTLVVKRYYGDLLLATIGHSRRTIRGKTSVDHAFQVTARRAGEPGAPAEITLETGPDTLTITDTGVGLTTAQVHELLATIGHSSKNELRATKELVDDAWAGVLTAFEKPVTNRPQLVLNHRCPLVERISRVTEPAFTTLAVEALYGQALLLGYHRLRPADAALLDRSFLGLLDHAVPMGDNR